MYFVDYFASGHWGDRKHKQVQKGNKQLYGQYGY